MPVNAVQVTFRGIPRSASLCAQVDQCVRKLERVCDKITRCRVTISQPHQHHTKGNPYIVTVDLAIPNREVVVSKGHNHADVYVAVRQAFEAVRRQLGNHFNRYRCAPRQAPRNAQAPLGS